MKYRYTQGPWKEFRGHVFAYGKPTEIRDRGTLAALEKEKDFEKVEDETKEEAQAVLDPKACPKCGKVIGRGRYFHEKNCRG